MVTAWRLVKSRLASRSLDGEGARRHGGRFSSPGTRVIYASESLALATLEVMAHLGDAGALASYSYFRIRFDPKLLDRLERRELPAGWRDYPAPAALRTIGDRWVAQGRSLALAVPSAIVPLEMNYLINPAHPGFRSVRIDPAQPLEPDPRLTNR